MTPLYRKVKDHVLRHIGSGAWPVDHRVPSEHELVRKLGVSRMTVNRALRELSEDGILTRIAGVGTFVADRTAHAHPLQVRNIRQEIEMRGHRYSAELITLESVRAIGTLAESFCVPPKTRLFHSVIIHFENDVPLQLEDRHVNPAIAADYLEVDFTTVTPHEHLMRSTPPQNVEHVLRADMPSDDFRAALKMAPDEPCLVLMRRTWAKGIVGSTARLYYPGTRYEFSGRFLP